MDDTADYEFKESAILNRLCEAGPLRLTELEREFDDADDCLGKLVRLGLANRLAGDFVVASAAGRHANHLDPTW